MKKIALISLGVLLLLLAAALGLGATAVRPVTLEAGEPFPDAAAFARYGFLPPRFADGTAPIPTDRPGTYPVTLRVLGIARPTTLTVSDTVPPVLTPQPKTCFLGEGVEIGALVTVDDATETALDYLTPPDFAQPGRQTVTVRATDLGGNHTTAEVELTVYAISHRLTVEAGTDPEVLREQIRTAVPGRLTFADDLDALDLTSPGERTLTITLDGQDDRLVLTVADTTPPAASPQAVSLLLGQTAPAEAFARGVSDATAVTFTFAGTPDFSAGLRPVRIRMTDEAGNAAELDAVLRVYAAPAQVTLELGSDYDEMLETLIPDPRLQPEDDLYPLLDAPTLGEHQVTYTTAGGTALTQTVIFTDTEAPLVRVQNRTAYVGDALEAADFVSVMADAGGIAAVRYADTPADTAQPGVQTVEIAVSDHAGNTTRITASLTVIADTEPPVIYGAADRTVYIGETVSYRSGVSAWDARDGSVAVQINSAQVNLRAAGRYSVTYTATDAAGNRAERTVTFTVSAVDADAINAMADAVLAEILHDGMSERQQLRAIYDWSVSHLRYTAYADKTDPVRAAYYGFRQGHGDCFVYYAVTRFLLTRAGFENLEIQRNDPANPHFWNLVRYDGNWYHLDTCPSYPDHPLVCFLLTDAEVQAYSRDHVKDYYRFDASRYPATP